MEGEVITKRIEVEQLILSLGLLIFQLGNQDVQMNINEIFLGEDFGEEIQGVRNDLVTTTDDIRLLYLCDPLEGLNDQLMQRVANETQDWN